MIEIQLTLLKIKSATKFIGTPSYHTLFRKYRGKCTINRVEILARLKAILYNILAGEYTRKVSLNPYFCDLKSTKVFSEPIQPFNTRLLYIVTKSFSFSKNYSKLRKHKIKMTLQYY